MPDNPISLALQEATNLLISPAITLLEKLCCWKTWHLGIGSWLLVSEIQRMLYHLYIYSGMLSGTKYKQPIVYESVKSEHCTHCFLRVTD